MPAVPTENLAIDVPDLLRRWGGVVDRQLDAVLDRAAEAPPRLIEAMRYSLLAGGKRLRPTLVLETCRTCQNGATSQPGPSVLAAAAAIELIHTFSLVHDDLPAMDDDDLRRGLPTVHVKFGEAMAILAGDLLSGLAFAAIADEYAEMGVSARLTGELAAATTAMIAGQVYDIYSVFPEGLSEREKLDLIHRHKTGALIRCACRMGAICAGADDDELASITLFAEALGLMFQIVDDVLDVTESAERLGKRSGKDAAAGKLTFPGVLGLEEARAEIERQRDLAIAALARFGESAQPLRELCHLLAVRTK